MNIKNKEILRNILYAVETGGQIYGCKRYDAFTEAKSNTSNEKAITIGAGQWYGTEARELLMRIREVAYNLFVGANTNGLNNDIDNANWNFYSIDKTSKKALYIVQVISSDIGIIVQDKIMFEQIDKYEKEVLDLGITDEQAIAMLINVRHLGGLSAVKRIIGKMVKPYTLESVYKALKSDQLDNSSDNQVGDKLYWSRQEKVYGWIKEKMESEGENLLAAEKRKKVKENVLSREGKNSYTQSEKRTKVDSGYSDCSSLMQWAYKQIGIEIGSYTGAQIDNGEWVQLGGTLPDESKMLIGDLLFFATNYENGRPYRVGHVEMYVGNGQISGHGSGIGPTRKNMNTYCQQRNSSGEKFIGVKRYIKSDVDEKITDTGNDEMADTSMFTGECTGNNVNVRKGPSTSYGLVTEWQKLNKGNLVDVFEQIGSWYKVRIAGKYIGYVYKDYIKKHNEENKNSNEVLNRKPLWVGKVTADTLNVRSWAGASSPKIKSWPQLGKENLVDVCDTIKALNGDDWYYIRIDGRIYGFVSAKFIKRV